MTAVGELLARIFEIGATIRPVGVDGLIVRAGTRPVPGELMLHLRKAKAEVLAALAPTVSAGKPVTENACERDADRGWWRRELVVRTLDRSLSNRTRGEAELLTLNDLIVEWHRRHGARVPNGYCAGCGEPIGGLLPLDLADGNRVHFDRLECLLSFGERWRSEAVAGLRTLGLDLPADFEPL